jgi:hypothetical protein
MLVDLKYIRNGGRELQDQPILIGKTEVLQLTALCPLWQRRSRGCYHTSIDSPWREHPSRLE